MTCSDSGILSRCVCRILGAAYGRLLRGFPPFVRVETTNDCNARCVLCRHARMKRPVVRMSDGLFACVMAECGEQGVRDVQLHNFGEPLMDECIEDRVRLARRSGVRRVRLFTNGSLLTGERARGLIEAGLSELCLSVDGDSAGDFERLRPPLRFDAVVANMRRLAALRDACGSSLRIRVVSCLCEDPAAVRRLFGGAADAFSFGRRHRWGRGGADGGVRIPCWRLWQTFTVLADGTVASCCLDCEGEQVLGRMGGGSTIRAVWNGHACRRARCLHTEAKHGELVVCRRCEKSFWPGYA